MALEEEQESDLSMENALDEQDQIMKSERDAEDCEEKETKRQRANKRTKEQTAKVEAHRGSTFDISLPNIPIHNWAQDN